MIKNFLSKTFAFSDLFVLIIFLCSNANNTKASGETITGDPMTIQYNLILVAAIVILLCLWIAVIKRISRVRAIKHPQNGANPVDDDGDGLGLIPEFIMITLTLVSGLAIAGAICVYA